MVGLVDGVPCRCHVVVTGLPVGCCLLGPWVRFRRMKSRRRGAGQDKGRALTPTEVGASVRENVALTLLVMAPHQCQSGDVTWVSLALSSSPAANLLP